MIVKTSFFKNELYLPHAKASITDPVVDVESKLESFIRIYEVDALQKCLGRLSIEFFKNIDASEPSLIKAGSDAKWDWLMNGHTYIHTDGDEYIWKGLREIRSELGKIDDDAEPDYSFLAEYIYFHYESNNVTVRADSGSYKVNAANSVRADYTWKVVGAWRRFVYAVQGGLNEGVYGIKEGVIGGSYADYRGSFNEGDVPLYQFIYDMNHIEPDTYPDFNPKRWEMINRMTI